jgi:hypothetical protein
MIAVSLPKGHGGMGNFQANTKNPLNSVLYIVAAAH